MLKLAQVQDYAHHAEPARPTRAPRPQHLYYAFLSYSHKDKEDADWLHDELERFRVPRSLEGRLTENGIIPKTLKPIFRDRHELAAADDLGEEIREALAASRFLIVLCSPDAAKSRWTNAEIEAFKRSHPDGCVLAAILSGEPFASDIPGSEDQECFPPALTHKYDRRGRPTGKRVEPLAADLRESGDGRRMGFLKLVAGMLGVGLDDLVQREATHRHRRLAWLAAASVAGMAVTSGLAITAIQARDAARDERREAEGLVAFMLGDLKEKLEPIGRLDALDGVGSRVLAYYSKQDASELSDAALLQRSRALSLMAQVAYLRGNLDAALRLYREAMAGTAEAINRKADDPQRLFDHAQLVFAVGDIARQRGDLRSAEGSAREYKALALRMVALGPDNMQWRMEEQYADANLGIALLEQRRFGEAAAQFQQALQTIEALATADRRNAGYQKSLAETLAWLGDARLAEGRLQEATAVRMRQIAVLEQGLAQSGDDVGYRQQLIPARRALGNLYAARGDIPAGIAQLRIAVGHADRLLNVEPGNRLWLEFAANARLNLAALLLAARQTGEASTVAGAGCGEAQQLVSSDKSVQPWRVSLRDCQVLRARISLASGAGGSALPLAEQGLATARSVKTNDEVSDRFAAARALRIVGDAQRTAGQMAAARQSWSAALQAYSNRVPERPGEISEHKLLLERLGRAAEARPLAARLERMGYKMPV